MAAVTHVWHLCHLTWIPFSLETCKTLACSFFCFLTTSLASSYVTLCLKMLKRDVLRWHKTHTIYFLLTEACYSKGLQLSVKHPPKLGQIYVCSVCLRCTAQQHVCAQKQTSPVAKAPSWAWHNPPLGVQVTWRAPLSWLAEHCKLCFIFWQVSWSDKSPAGHFFSAHPVLRCCCLGQSLEILWESKSLKAFWQQDVIICPSAECIGWPPPGSFQK